MNKNERRQGILLSGLRELRLVRICVRVWFMGNERGEEEEVIGGWTKLHYRAAA